METIIVIPTTERVTRNDGTYFFVPAVAFFGRTEVIRFMPNAHKIMYTKEDAMKQAERIARTLEKHIYDSLGQMELLRIVRSFHAAEDATDKAA